MGHKDTRVLTLSGETRLTFLSFSTGVRRVRFAGLDRFGVLGWDAHVTEQVIVPVQYRVSVGVGDLPLSVDWGRLPTQVRLFKAGSQPVAERLRRDVRIRSTPGTDELHRGFVIDALARDFARVVQGRRRGVDQ